MSKSNKKNSNPFSIAAKKAWATRRKLYGPTGTPTKGKVAKKSTAKKVSKTSSKKNATKGFKIVASKNAVISSVTVRGRKTR